MKLNNNELEITILAHITKNNKSMDKLLSRKITKDHFDFVNDGDKVCYSSSLFKLIHDYWMESGGLLFTSFVLESKLEKYKVSEKNRTKLLSLWADVQDTDFSKFNCLGNGN